jgi:hypothetical protein
MTPTVPVSKEVGAVMLRAGALTVKDRVTVAEAAWASVTVKCGLLVPTLVGVPVNTPAALKANPAGSPPEDQV